MVNSYSIKKLKKAWGIPGLLGLLTVSAMAWSVVPVSAQSTYDLNNRVQRMENEIQTLSRAIYKGETPPPGSFSGGGSATADMEVRLQQMESDLRSMRGKVEEVAHENRQLKAQLERITSDLELRIQDLESGRSGGGAASSSSGSAPYTAGGSGRPSNESSSASGGNSYQWSSGANEQQLGSYSQSSGGGLSASSGSAEALYDNAFSLIKNEQYGAAEKEFGAFLSKYPSHALAGNAKYWLGESYYVRGDYTKAARVFAEGYQQYPKGSKVSDNLLKLGMSLAALGKTSDACVALGQLVKQKTAGNAPVVRRAEQEMSRLSC